MLPSSHALPSPRHLLALFLACCAGQSAAAQDTAPTRTGSAHAAQTRELGRAAHARSDDHAEAERLGTQFARLKRRLAWQPPVATDGGPAERSTRPGIDDDFIVFGYLQSETQVFHQRWHALTHVG